jgi:hypothetical protein
MEYETALKTAGLWDSWAETTVVMTADPSDLTMAETSAETMVGTMVGTMVEL